MTQSNIDTDFVDGLQLIIDSLIKEDESDIFDKSTAIEKIGPLAAVPAAIGAGLGAVGRVAGAGVGMAGRAAAVGVGRAAGTVAGSVGDSFDNSGIESADDDDLPEADHWCPDVMDWHTSDHEPAKAPSVHVNVDQDNGDDPYQSENTDVEKGAVGTAARVAAPLIGVAVGEKVANTVKKGEYDQNTNLSPEFGKPKEGESIAEPFLRKREHAEEDIEKSYDQSLDILKIWASVDRTLPKDDDLTLIDDLSILKSFDLGTSINVEDLVEGTLVHKMLVDRATRPTKEWWEAGIKLAVSIENIDEPAICTAFLYYEPDIFDIRDFQKADPGAGGGETQDIQNVGSASAMDGLGMSADDHAPEDKDCDT